MPSTASKRPPARPVSLSDDELSAMMAACGPLPPDRRSVFVQEVASALASCGEIGPGVHAGQAGTITIGGKAQQVGGDIRNSCSGKTLEQLRSDGQTYFLQR
jgi:hypothetical protein